MSEIKNELIEDEEPLFVPQAASEEIEPNPSIESITTDLADMPKKGSSSAGASDAPVTPAAADAPHVQIAFAGDKGTTKARAKQKTRTKKSKEPKAPKAPTKTRGTAKKRADAMHEMENSVSQTEVPLVDAERQSSARQEDACVFRLAKDKFPELPDEANPIDRAIFQRLAECWDEEAKGWDDEMRESFMKHLPRARVTKSTSGMSNHNLSKLLRQGQMEPEWGSFVILRVMFGPTNCFHQKWFAKLVKRYPQAQDPACDGVIPPNVADVFSGQAELVVPSKVKRKINQLGPDKSRQGGKRIKTNANGDAYIAKIMLGSAQEDGKSLELPRQVTEAFKDTFDAVDRFNPQDTIQSLKKQYSEQMNQISQLEKSNTRIMEALSQYRAYLGMLRGLHNNCLAPSPRATGAIPVLESDDANSAEKVLAALADEIEGQGDGRGANEGVKN